MKSTSKGSVSLAIRLSRVFDQAEFFEILLEEQIHVGTSIRITMQDRAEQVDMRYPLGLEYRPVTQHLRNHGGFIHCKRMENACAIIKFCAQIITG